MSIRFEEPANDLLSSFLPDNPTESLSIDIPDSLKVVKASFSECVATNWEELFDGYENLYAITFSSGIDFVNKVISRFKHTEIIFGCEGVMNSDTATIIAMQAKVVQKYVKHKSAFALAERLADGTLELFVSRDTKSHEKIYVLSSEDGRVRVITGSANMSRSAFCGLQRENILCFDDKNAFAYYKTLFDDFKANCSDSIPYKAIIATIKDNDYLEENIQEIPIVKTIEDKKMVFLEESEEDSNDYELVAGIKGFELELKPMIPKERKQNGKWFVTGEIIKEFKRSYSDARQKQKEKEKRLPKLHINYDSKSMDFNGKEISLHPSKQFVQSDLKALKGYFQGFLNFNGNVSQTQKNYYVFMNWFFASVFMPHLRLIAYNNNYEMMPFPVFGIVYGDSNGGKSTFTKLLSKMMCGHVVPLNSTSDFASSTIENLKRGREGLPIIIDDLAKMQFQNHNEKVIKDDEWGIPERFENYPAVVITTNKLPSITSDISKRAVTCYIDAKINKESGAKNSKRINDSLKSATTALFGEYTRRMLEKIDLLENAMKTEEDYFPDVFRLSSETICEIFDEFDEQRPVYITPLSFSDYFGDKAVGKNAIEKIKRAWQNEPKQFRINKRANKLVYSCGENGNIYALKYIHDELPPTLNAQLNVTSLVMDLDKAEELFEMKFKKKRRGSLT